MSCQHVPLCQLIIMIMTSRVIINILDSSNLRQCASPRQVGEAPASALPLRVDVGHDELPLAAHDQLRVVLEVVHLRERQLEFRH